jgi:hypothetical protein
MPPSCKKRNQTEAGLKAANKSRALKRASLESGESVPTQGEEASPAGTSSDEEESSSRKTCCHTLCKYAPVMGDPRKLRRIGADTAIRVELLTAMQRDKDFIKESCERRTDLRACAVHFDESGDCLLPFYQDPVVLGMLPGRNTLGDQWYVAHNAAHAKPTRRNALEEARAKDPHHAEMSKLLQHIEVLQARIDHLERSKAGMAGAVEKARRRSEGAALPVPHCLPEGIGILHFLFPSPKHCVYYTSYTPEQLDLVLRVVEAIRLNVVYDTMMQCSSNPIPFREAFLIMIIRLRCFFSWTHLARLCGREDTQISRVVHSLISSTSEAIVLFFSEPLTQDLEEKFKVDGFKQPEFAKIRHIFDGEIERKNELGKKKEKEKERERNKERSRERERSRLVARHASLISYLCRHQD